jgi:hypothetical protein
MIASCGNLISTRIAHRTLRVDSQEERLEKKTPYGTTRNVRCAIRDNRYSTITRSVAPRPKVSGLYISSAFVGGTTNTPGVVARATYE